MSPLSVVLQAPASQTAQIDSQISIKPFSRDRSLSARWALEAGKLVYHWFPVKSYPNN